MGSPTTYDAPEETKIGSTSFEHPEPAEDQIPEHVDQFHAGDVFPEADSLAEAHALFHKQRDVLV